MLRAAVAGVVAGGVAAGGRRERRIGILVYDRMTLLDAVGPAEVRGDTTAQAIQLGASTDGSSARARPAVPVRRSSAVLVAPQGFAGLGEWPGDRRSP
ncbi:hypothetical protein [Actinosynnema sp. NPDC023587]|uniref:hypothetical protein n=1 Tax=Actinosynnema sp. NPDC023587 TaxID=3154695 RepID=UPI00340C9BE4